MTMELYEIAKYQKVICGIETEYYFFKKNSECYRIVICRENQKTHEDFTGDFFETASLFKLIVDTDTLPENLSEIASDIKNSFCV